MQERTALLPGKEVFTDSTAELLSQRPQLVRGGSADGHT